MCHPSTPTANQTGDDARLALLTCHLPDHLTASPGHIEVHIELAGCTAVNLKYNDESDANSPGVLRLGLQGPLDVAIQVLPVAMVRVGGS